MRLSLLLLQRLGVQELLVNADKWFQLEDPLLNAVCNGDELEVLDAIKRGCEVNAWIAITELYYKKR
jgi:hypothetical protein